MGVSSHLPRSLAKIDSHAVAASIYEARTGKPLAADSQSLYGVLAKNPSCSSLPAEEAWTPAPGTAGVQQGWSFKEGPAGVLGNVPRLRLAEKVVGGRVGIGW